MRRARRFGRTPAQSPGQAAPKAANARFIGRAARVCRRNRTEQTPAKTADGLPAAAQGETEKRRRTGAEEKQRIVRRIGAQIKAEKRPQQCDGPLQEAGRAPEDEMKGIKNSPGSAFRGRSFKDRNAFIKIFQNVRPSALFANGKTILRRKMALLRLPAWHGRNIPGRRGIRF